MGRRLLLLAIVSVLGCDAAPLETRMYSTSDIRETLELSNFDAHAGSTRVIARWRVPIEVNTNGIERAETALRHYEQWTGGLVLFTRVSTNPVNGIAFAEGGGHGPDGPGGCGNVHDGPPTAPHSALNVRFDNSGAFTGLYSIQLGSSTCDDASEGHYESAVAEHELGHALGLSRHFDGFVGNEGFSHPLMFAVIYTLYANPVGTPKSSVRVYGGTP
ncbi:MAG: hypothetical protein ACT4O1_14575 [Gemmatimonadota bacterium]